MPCGEIIVKMLASRVLEVAVFVAVAPFVALFDEPDDEPPQPESAKTAPAKTESATAKRGLEMEKITFTV